MKLWKKRLGVPAHSDQTRSGLDDFFSYLGHNYPLGVQTSQQGEKVRPAQTFEDFAAQFLSGNPIVYAASAIRQSVFSQGVFKWQDKSNGRVFGNNALRRLEAPYPAGTTSRMLKRMLVHADAAGNAYLVDFGDKFGFMRPDWVTIVMGSNLDEDDPVQAEDAEVLGYMYGPPGAKPRLYFADQVVHFMPRPDPLVSWRGMSWLTPLIREIQADDLSTRHKLKFFENAASPNLVIKFDASQTVKQVQNFKSLMEGESNGVMNAYKNLYLGGGADVEVIGANMQQMDFSSLQGKAETRILMAAGVHPVIAGASEGMQGASLNAGNFKQIRRVFSDIHLQDLWLEASSAFSQVVRPPNGGTALVVSGQGMPFLQDDALDQSTIFRTNVTAIGAAVRDGFTPDSSVAAAVGNDLSQLKHSGKLSVQLQEDKEGTTPADDEGEPTDSDSEEKDNG